MPGASSRWASSQGRPRRADRRDRPRIRRLLLRRGLCRRCGRCRCRCRPASAAAKPMSSSSSCMLTSSDPALFLYPPELAEFAGAAAAQRGVAGARLGQPRRASSRRPAELPDGRRRRHRLSAIFERLDPLPARRRGHPPRAARQPPRPRPRPRGRATPTAASRWLPWYHDMGLVGCMLSPIANQIIGRLSEDRGFRPPPARLARPDQPQSRAPRSAIRRPSATTSARAACRRRPAPPTASTCRAGGSPATAPT